MDEDDYINYIESAKLEMMTIINKIIEEKKNEIDLKKKKKRKKPYNKTVITRHNCEGKLTYNYYERRYYCYMRTGFGKIYAVPVKRNEYIGIGMVPDSDILFDVIKIKDNYYEVAINMRLLKEVK